MAVDPIQIKIIQNGPRIKIGIRPPERIQIKISSAGSQGIQGEPGVDVTYVHIQGVPATTWNVTHNLNKFPSVSIINSIDEVVYGLITYVDANNITLQFSASFSGRAFFN